MNKQPNIEPNKTPIQSCDKLLESFFSLTLKSEKDIDSQIVEILEKLYKEKRLTADNITKVLRDERTKIHE
jgi:hypothetical protein